MCSILSAAAARRPGWRRVGIDTSSFATGLVRDAKLKDGSIPFVGKPPDMDGACRLPDRSSINFKA